MKGKYVFRRILWGLLLVFIFGGSVFAQQKKLTINLKNGSFAQLTDQIKKQSDYTFFFNNAMVMSLKKITIQVKEVTLDSVLNIALKGSDLTYKIRIRRLYYMPRRPRKRLPKQLNFKVR